MTPFDDPLPRKSRLAILLDHFATIPDPRDVRRIAHPSAEVLLLVVCGTIADCDDYDHFAAWARPISRSCTAIYPTGTACRADAGSPS